MLLDIWQITGKPAGKKVAAQYDDIQWKWKTNKNKWHRKTISSHLTSRQSGSMYISQATEKCDNSPS